VKNPIYKGRLEYGRRTKDKDREVLWAPVEPLVSEEVWEAAQQTLERYRFVPSGAVPRKYLLRSVVKCGNCGLNYTGTPGKPGVYWFCCNGFQKYRGQVDGKCCAKAIRGDQLEQLIWAQGLSQCGSAQDNSRYPKRHSDGLLRQLAFGILVAVDAQLGGVGEVATEFEEERAKVPVHAIELVVID
jgi:hypothetical protein